MTTAVLVIDMMKTYRHEDAELLVPNVEKIIGPLAGLVRQARRRDDVELVYANDNYGDFTGDFDDLVRSALDGYIRHFEVAVARDAVAHIDAELGDAALKMMERNMRATVAPAAECLK